MAILYNLREKEEGLPVPMSDFKEVKFAVTDGKALSAYGYPAKPVRINQIYAFHLDGNVEQLLKAKLLKNFIFYINKISVF